MQWHFLDTIESKACRYHNTSDYRPENDFSILSPKRNVEEFGVRPQTLYGTIKRTVAKLPEQLRSKRIHFWDVQRKTAPGKFRMAVEKLSDIPADRPLTTAERKALFEELKDAKARLVCAESLLEVAVESCKDDLKKKSCSGS